MGELTASIAHEVLQPLAAVTANADAGLRWLAEARLTSTERERVSRIARDGKHAGEVITRVRALVKKSPPTKAWLDLTESIQEALVVINIEAERHQVSVGTELAAGLPLLQADRVQLQPSGLEHGDERDRRDEGGHGSATRVADQVPAARIRLPGFTQPYST